MPDLSKLKKGSRINPRFFHNFEDQPVWVEFDCTGITMQETDEETNSIIDELRTEHPDAWYRLIKCGFGGYSLYYINPDGTMSSELPLATSHNLISGIYAVNEDEV